MRTKKPVKFVVDMHERLDQELGYFPEREVSREDHNKISQSFYDPLFVYGKTEDEMHQSSEV